VSEPLNHTLNDDGSVSVTCMFWAQGQLGVEGKLKMNNEYVCEISDKKEDDKCNWQHSDNKFTFTLRNLYKSEDLLKNEFSCEISKVDPVPIITEVGPKMKLFRGKFTPFQHHSTV